MVQLSHQKDTDVSARFLRRITKDFSLLEVLSYRLTVIERLRDGGSEKDGEHRWGQPVTEAHNRVCSLIPDIPDDGPSVGIQVNPLPPNSHVNAQ